MGGPDTPRSSRLRVRAVQKRFRDHAAVDNEDDFEGQAAKDFKKSHDQFHKLDPIFPLQPCWQVIPCTLHYLMGCTKH
jgi:hypothetical protein